jgi:GMP synthase-like glutamine amidotransferase
MKVLLIDNTRDRDSWGSSDLRRALTLPDGKPQGIALMTLRAPHEDLPSIQKLMQFDRLVLSGSATSVNEDAQWIDALLGLIRSAVDRKIPLLGICYGHQMLARALAGKQAVRKAAAPEIGWATLELKTESKLTQGLPQRFETFSNHHDEVCTLPEGAALLASSDICPVQAFALTQAPAYGIQFHPERDLEGAAETFTAKKKLKPVPALIRAGEGTRLYNPAIAATIVRNFYSP